MHAFLCSCTLLSLSTLSSALQYVTTGKVPTAEPAIYRFFVGADLGPPLLQIYDRTPEQLGERLIPKICNTTSSLQNTLFTGPEIKSAKYGWLACGRKGYPL
jgi:hypothetical protein